MNKWIAMLCIVFSKAACASSFGVDDFFLNIVMSDSVPSISVLMTDSCSPNTVYLIDPSSMQFQPIEQFSSASNGMIEGYCIPVGQYPNITLASDDSNCIGFAQVGALKIHSLTLDKPFVFPTCGGAVGSYQFGSMYIKTNLSNFKIGKQFAKGPNVDFISISKSIDVIAEPFYGVVYQLTIN